MTIRKLFLAATLPAALTLVGCGPTPSTGGGTKTEVTKAKETGDPAHPTKAEKVGEVDEKVEFQTVVGSPFGVKQEATRDVTLGLNRGKDLKADLEASAKSSDDKVKVEIPSPKLPAAGDGKILVKVTPAANAAADTEATITVEVKGGKTPAKQEFKVKIEKK